MHKFFWNRCGLTCCVPKWVGNLLGCLGLLLVCTVICFPWLSFSGCLSPWCTRFCPGCCFSTAFWVAVCVGHFISFISFSSFMGRVMSMFTCIWSACCMFMLPISHSITSSTTCIVTGCNSSKGKYLNSFPYSSGCSLMVSSISMSLDRVSAKVFRIPGMYSNVMFCYSSSTAQLFTFEFRVFFSRNFFSGRWSLFTVILVVSM